jgi:hypothetical protein
LREFLVSGEEKILNEKLKYKVTGTELLLYSSEDCSRSIEFYIADLVSGQFLNKKDPELIRIAQKEGMAVINLEKFTPSYLRFREIVCACKTKQGNEWITSLKLDL